MCFTCSHLIWSCNCIVICHSGHCSAEAVACCVSMIWNKWVGFLVSEEWNGSELAKLPLQFPQLLTSLLAYSLVSGFANVRHLPSAIHLYVWIEHLVDVDWYLRKCTHTCLLFKPLNSPPPSSSPSNWAVSGVQVEAIWIPSGRDHCGSLWHSRTSHFQTICNIFLPSVTLIPQSLCHLDTPEQFVVKNTSADMQDQMEGGINIVINSVESACCMIHNVLHIRLARGAVQFMF